MKHSKREGGGLEFSGGGEMWRQDRKMKIMGYFCVAGHPGAGVQEARSCI